MFIKLSVWVSSIFLIFLLISFFAANSSSMSASYSYHDESGSISDSQNYNLDSSTTMKSITIFDGSSMEQTIMANGKGQNSLGQQINGNLYSFQNTVSSSGSFGVSSSTTASSTDTSQSQSVAGVGKNNLGQSIKGDGYNLQNAVSSSGLLSDSSSASAGSGSLSHQVAGVGDVSFVGTGAQGEDNSAQKADVASGFMASSYDLSAGDGVFSGQNTAISGESGSLGSGSLSSGNMVLVTGALTAEAAWMQSFMQWLRTRL
jgi:hypothetical protein